MNKKRCILQCMALLILFVFVGCATTRTQGGALVGGTLGAVTGAVLGHQTGHRDEGALIGAGIGALTGALVGDQFDEIESRRVHTTYTAPQTRYNTSREDMHIMRAPSGERYEERGYTPVR